MLQRGVLAAVVLAVVARVATAQPVEMTPESSIRWAEGLLAKASLPTTRYVGLGPRRDLGTAEDAFDSIIAKYGRDPRALAGRARAEVRLGKYEAALASFREAATLSPTNETVRRDEREAERLSQIAGVVSGTLPRGQAILRVLAFPTAGLGSWLVLSAKAVLEDREAQLYDSPRYYSSASDVRLSLFIETPSQVRWVWQSGPLRHSSTDIEFSDVQLDLVDLTGNGVLDVVVTEIMIGASWCPSHLAVFAWRGGRMAQLLDLSSDEPLSIVDLNHDSKYEVCNDHAIGSDLAHFEQPRWQDIYAYKQGRYVLADSDYPGKYTALYEDIQQKLKRYPNDSELPKYLAMCYEIQGKPQTALKYYRLAEKREREPSKLKDIQRRIRIVAGGGKSV